ncbi:hypothetical protein J0X14_01185 [Muricauda sp. CAU 1633]|uniref:prephenate dehydratase domain-containing protein n=1 Tax=Allomuricauda sp. CAU 1633 TaxID=2816036 RepID=UPI001A8EB0BF|nr:prephenate dehydratase domain-containing protein [Muricauda sp. CAU 1633]MBO0320894.1 hypothetical protein [Muricauda sp. CAU 1633]
MSERKIRIGIQGGRGSFNDTAVRTYLKDKNTSQHEILYLNTTANVLKAIHENKIELGQFALYNSTGGIYGESLNEIGKYTFTVLDTYKIRISHALMISKAAKMEEVDTIITHPQVMKQCRLNLSKKYSHLKLKVGEGELTDPARVAEKLGAGELSKNVAVVSNELLAEVYDLKVVETGLEDHTDNESTFLLVSKI